MPFHFKPSFLSVRSSLSLCNRLVLLFDNFDETALIGFGDTASISVGLQKSFDIWKILRVEQERKNKKRESPTYSLKSFEKCHPLLLVLSGSSQVP